MKKPETCEVFKTSQVSGFFMSGFRLSKRYYFSLLPGNCKLPAHRIIHLHTFPKVCAVGNELLVYWMFLIHILIGFVFEYKRDRITVRMVNYGAARGCRNANVCLPDLADARQDLQTRIQRILGRLAVRVFEPEINRVDESGFRVFHGFGGFVLGGNRKNRAAREQENEDFFHRRYSKGFVRTKVVLIGFKQNSQKTGGTETFVPPVCLH